ncbi:terminase large subunit domain-containing protein [Pseudoxanthomonas mexicana]
MAIDVSHDALQRGRACEDRVRRQIVTIMDAQRRGCDLFDIDELREEYSPDAFANLLMCEFVDDSASVFPLSLLQGCGVDSWVSWAGRIQALRAAPLWRLAGLGGLRPGRDGRQCGLGGHRSATHARRHLPRAGTSQVQGR